MGTDQDKVPTAGAQCLPEEETGQQKRIRGRKGCLHCAFSAGFPRGS